jgi:pyruvate/2-oxoglutarate dehydrogenase complex dihydrolipoamide dehydrogenase (E3) component
VTVIEKFPKLLPREDEDVVAEIRAILEREGVDIFLGAEDLNVSKSGKQISVKFAGRSIAGSHLLLAVGRIPNTGDLGLKEGGISADPRGFITVDDQCRTSAEGVWAMGDVNGKGAFTHTSWNDYEIVAANLFDSDPRKISDRISCYALFIDPPLGRVGMNEAEAKKSGRKLLAGKMLMTRVGRAREMGETQGFMKVLVDADTKELLGAAILGLNGDEVVHSLLDVMYAKKPYTTIQRAVHIHPTVTELVPTLLGTLKPMAA